jgi:hypothetical protein
VQERALAAPMKFISFKTVAGAWLPLETSTEVRGRAPLRTHQGEHHRQIRIHLFTETPLPPDR